MSKPKYTRFSVDVTHDNKVFIYWIDENTSGTLTISPESAINIGAVGRMAGVRRDGIQFLEDNNL